MRAASPRSSPARRSAVSKVSPRLRVISTGSGSPAVGAVSGVSATAGGGGAGSRVGTASPSTPRASRIAAERRQCERFIRPLPEYPERILGPIPKRGPYAPYLVKRSALAISIGMRSCAGITPSEPLAQSRSVNRLT